MVPCVALKQNEVASRSLFCADGIKCIEHIFDCVIIQLSNGSDDPGLKVKQIIWRHSDSVT